MNIQEITSPITQHIPILKPFVECPQKPLAGFPPHGFNPSCNFIDKFSYNSLMCHRNAMSFVSLITSEACVTNANITDQFGLEHISLTHVSPDLRKLVRKSFQPYANVWSGHLGSIDKVKHRINLIPGIQPFMQAS